MFASCATQLGIVDEWSWSRMSTDMAKTVFQGGWMVTEVKHGPAKCFMNNSPFYITTNHVPSYGDEDDNVKRRLEIFETKSLGSVQPGVDRWIFDHAMHCVAWVANEITSNRHLIDPEELWYEADDSMGVQIQSDLYRSRLVTSITSADLQGVTTLKEQDELIHSNFVAARLSRQRARQWTNNFFANI